MKELTPWLVAAALTFGWLLDRDQPVVPVAVAQHPAIQTGQVEEGPAWASFTLGELAAERAASGRFYLPFLGVATLRAGLYELPAGADDPQQPHGLDEVYYVAGGRAVLDVDGARTPVQPGAVLYVKANVPHRFTDITEDLRVLVFFSEAAPAE